jgi:hypothetical protein
VPPSPSSFPKRSGGKWIVFSCSPFSNSYQAPKLVTGKVDVRRIEVPEVADESIDQEGLPRPFHSYLVCALEIAENGRHNLRSCFVRQHCSTKDVIDPPHHTCYAKTGRKQFLITFLSPHQIKNSEPGGPRDDRV